MEVFKKAAFTLAEVLIVLGIIGVVAEMTIPTVMNNVQDQATKSAWKKAYSVFSQAYLLMQADSIIDWGASDMAMRDVFTPYFKTSKICDNAGNDCWHTSGLIKTLPMSDGTQYAMSDHSARPGIVTLDGMFIIFHADSTTQGWVMVDVNGAKKPNVVGKDIFGLRIGPDKTAPFTHSEFGNCNPASAGTAGSGYIGMGCSTDIIMN